MTDDTRRAQIAARLAEYRADGYEDTDPESDIWDGFVPVAARLFANAPNDIRWLLAELTRLETHDPNCHNPRRKE